MFFFLTVNKWPSVLVVSDNGWGWTYGERKSFWQLLYPIPKPIPVPKKTGHGRPNLKKNKISTLIFPKYWRLNRTAEKTIPKARPDAKIIEIKI